jgi:hypothetical protein
MQRVARRIQQENAYRVLKRTALLVSRLERGRKQRQLFKIKLGEWKLSVVSAIRIEVLL